MEKGVFWCFPTIIWNTDYSTTSYVVYALVGGSLQNQFYFWPWWNFSRLLTEQSKSEGFDSCDRPSNLAQIWSKSSICSPRDVEIWWMTSQNNRAPILYYIKLCASFQIHRWIQTEDTVQKRSIWVKIDDFFPCDLEIWWMTLENNRAPLLYYMKLCA